MNEFPLDGFRVNQCELSNDEQRFILDCIYMAAKEGYYDTDFGCDYCNEMGFALAEKFDIAKFGLDATEFKRRLEYYY